MAGLDTGTFLDLLQPMTDQHEHISKKWSIDPNDPMLYWILRDADFRAWESANNSQVLWIFGGPPGCAITGVSSHIAKQQASRRDGAVFYFSCSMDDSHDVTGFTHFILRHILDCSNSLQANLIIKAFLSNLLQKILERDQSCIPEDGSSTLTVEKILNASGGELLEALTDAVGEIKSIQDMMIIIDGMDEIWQDMARFFQKFCSKMMKSSTFKALFTCRQDPDIKKMVDGVPCIDYDKERHGLGTPYLQVVSRSN
jgi:hypothetical protein